MIRNHGGRQHANANAQKEVDDLVRAAGIGGELRTEDVVRFLNQNRSRAYTPIRAGCILKTRSDIRRVADGLWEVTAVPA